MNNKDTYILQVDLPDGAKKGDRYEFHGNVYCNVRLIEEAKGIIECRSWETWQVENNPTFFKKKEEPPIIINLESDKNYAISYDYTDLANGNLGILTGSTIIDAIVMKNKYKNCVQNHSEMITAAEKRGYEAAKVFIADDEFGYYKYPTFQDYLNSLK